MEHVLQGGMGANSHWDSLATAVVSLCTDELRTARHQDIDGQSCGEIAVQPR